MVALIWAKAERSHREPSERDKIWIKRLHPACPASLDTLKVSVPPAVKLAAASARSRGDYTLRSRGAVVAIDFLAASALLFRTAPNATAYREIHIFLSLRKSNIDTPLLS